MGSWHPVNISHLVMGIAFLGLVGIWGLLKTDAVTTDATQWLLPLPWIVAGTAGLLAALVTARTRHHHDRSPIAANHEENR